MIKKLLYKILPMSVRKQLNNFKILAIEYGQYKTIKNSVCVDKYGNYIPWYTYPAIEFLNNFDFKQKIIFEYGSGSSSFYWAQRAKKVISVEHDIKWFEKLKNHISDNQILLYKNNNEEYENSISEFEEKFDVIIIDGIRRSECTRIIKNYLNFESDEGVMVILDNSDWYKESSKFLRNELNLIEIDFHGFGPINNYTWTTSVFIYRNFNFKPNDGIQPHFSTAAIQYSGE